MIVGSTLKRWRHATGLTQEQAARVALVSRHRLALAETDAIRLGLVEVEALKSAYLAALHSHCVMALEEMSGVDIENATGSFELAYPM